ncbi:MAG: hypothetical protein ACFFDF_08645 [Candidatus Odinarchaeota archaeon]
MKLPLHVNKWGLAYDIHDSSQEGLRKSVKIGSIAELVDAEEIVKRVNDYTRQYERAESYIKTIEESQEFLEKTITQNRDLVEILKKVKQEYDDNEFSGCMNTYGEICKVLERAEGAK